MKRILLLLILAITGYGANAQCLVEISLDGNGLWGDEVTWQLLDETSTPILTGGPYGAPPWTANDTVTANPLGVLPYSFVITSVGGFFCDNAAIYTISLGGTVVATGTHNPCTADTITFLDVCPACPPVPSGGLTSVVSLPDTVDLSWPSAGVGVTYTVDYRVAGSGVWTPAPGNPQAGTSVQITGLAPDFYEWQIAAICPTPDTSDYTSSTFTTFPYPGTCADAIPITAGTYTAPGPSSGGGALAACASFGVNANWYQYIPSASGTVTVSSDLSGTLDDTYLEVYEGSCGALTCVGSNDDGGVTNIFASVLTFNVCVGDTIYLHWDDSYDNTPIEFSLTESLGCLAPLTAAINPTTDGYDPTTSWTAGSGSCGGGYQWEVVPNGSAGFAGNDLASGSGFYPVAVPAVTGLAPGTPYDLVVRDSCAGPAFSAITLTDFTTLPLNFPDSCFEAIAIGAGLTSAPGPTTGVGASNNCFTGAISANWYSYTPAASGSVTITSDLASNPASLDSRVSVYTGTCGALTCLASDDDAGGAFAGFSSIVTFNVCAGTTYLIEWDDRWANGQVPFNFELIETPGCNAPSNIVAGLATEDGLLDVSWDPGSGTCASASGYIYEIVLLGDAPFAGNDIQSGSGTYPVLPFDITGLNASTDYEIWIRDDCGGGLTSDSIGGFWTTLTPPPVNDDCADAIVVYGGYSITGFSTEGATGADMTTCTFNDVASVWFEYTPTCDDSITVNSCGSNYDTNISIFDDCAGTTELACNDDANFGPCNGTLQSAVGLAVDSGTTYYIRIAGFNGATGLVNFSITEVNGCPCTQNVWTGATSSDWNDATNWTCGVVPTNSCGAALGSDNAVVPAGLTVIPVVTGTQGAVNLEVGSGASITIDGTLQVCGDVDHNGNALTGAGSLALLGSANQVLTGNGAFGIIELDNAAGATVMGSANLSADSALVLTSGVFTNNGSFSLNSALGATAYLDDFTGTGSYAGDLTVNRFVTDGHVSGLGQRLFGSAVSGSRAFGLDNTYTGYPTLDYISPVPTCDPDSIMPNSAYSNLMSYDENVPTFCSQAGWFAEQTSSAILTPTRGYSGWMSNGSTVSVTGTPNTGGQASALLSNTPTNVQGVGYHVLSNPYPSPISLTSIATGGLTSPQYYESSTGQWSGTYQPAAVSGATIPVMQGFTAFSDGTGSLVLANTDRVASTNGFFAKSNSWFDYKLDVEVSVGGNGDITYLYYSGNTTAQFDIIGDCEKRLSDATKPTLYTRNSSKMMSLNGLNLNDLGMSVPLGLVTPTATAAEFTFAGMDDFPTNTVIYLEDKVEGVFHNMQDGPYAFDADPAQNGTDRFEIHFSMPASFNLIEPTCENDQAIIVENTNDGRTFTIANQGVVEYTGVLDGSQNVLSHGDYEIEVFDAFGTSQTYVFVIDEVVAVDATVISSDTDIEIGEEIDFDYAGSGANNFEWYIDGQLMAQTELFNFQFNLPGEYLVELEASNDICDDHAEETIIVSEKSTSIVNVGDEGVLNIYPDQESNIVLEFINVDQGIVSASVYNLLGQEIANARLNSNGKHIIRNAKWAQGYYIVKVQIGTEVVNQTVLINQ